MTALPSEWFVELSIAIGTALRLVCLFMLQTTGMNPKPIRPTSSPLRGDRYRQHCRRHYLRAARFADEFLLQ